MASGHITGNTVNSRWYAYADWSTSESNTSVTLTVKPWLGVNGYNCSYNNVTGGASIDFSESSSGSVSVNKNWSQGLTWYEFPSASKSWNRTKSQQTIYFSSWATFPAGSSNWSGTSNAYGTLVIDPLPSYTVSYNANGGSGAPGNQTKWYGETLTLSGSTPSRTGYIFKGWATSSGGSVAYAAGANYTANSGATLYAVWQAVTYTVAYNANGGSGAPSNQTKTYGVNLTLSSTKPTRTNYNFKGWGTSASSTTVAYAPGATYSDNAAITLYAVWELAWVAPRITNLDATRCDSAGNFTDEGTYAKVSFSWATDRTISSIKIVCNSVTYTPSGTGTSGTVSMVIGNGGLSTESSYTVTITVTDAVGNSSSTTIISPMHFIMDFSQNGGVGIGQPAPDKPVLESSISSYFNRGIGTYRGSNWNSSNSNLWYKIGTYSPTNNSGDLMVLYLYGFSGYNAIPKNQNNCIRIIIQDSANSSGYFGVSVSGLGGAYFVNDLVAVKVLANSYTNCDVWVKCKKTWPRLSSIVYANDNYWTYADIAPQSAEPSYGTECPVYYEQAVFLRDGPNMVLPPNATFDMYNRSGARQNILSIDSSNVVGLNIWDIWFKQMPGGNIFKELWSGTWASGSINVPGASLYNVFAFWKNSNNPVMLGCRTQRNSGTIHAIGGGYWGSVWVNTLHINISGDTMSMYHSNSTALNNGSNQMDGIEVSHIIGII